MGARSQRKRIVSKPFPGLRPFLRDENLIFFGREGQTDELIARLKRNHFLAVLGASGSGKSSMVRAGLLPALEGGLMAGARAKWKMAVFRPGDRPIHEMALALSGLINAAEDPSFQVISPLEMISTMLDASSYGLKEAALGPILREDENLLVVVDQFEEIFRFQEENTGESKVDEAKAFIKLLLEASSDPNLPIYVVITMRSDFLGECPRFRHLPEAINAGQYLVPRLPRSQMRQAITGPVAVFGEAFAPDLVIRLLNDVGEAQDQLPILQHALMRTWDHHTPGTEVGVKDYEAIGGLENALNQHAEEIFAELEAKGLGEATGFVFSCLTQTESDGKGIRRPARFSDICASTGLEAESVKTIVEAFRASGRSFLMPPVGVALEPETIIDISHESFMRLWTRLEAWVEEESRSAEEYRKLSHAATEHALGKVNLWRMPELGIALKWKDENQPSAEWASRYDQNFEAAMAFLAASQKAWKAEEEEKAAMLVVQQQAEKSEKELRRQKLTTRGLAAMVVVLLMAVGAAIYYAYEASAQEQKARASTYAALSTSEKLLVQKDSLILKNNEILAATKENKRLQTEKDSIENSKTIYITALNDTLTKNNKVLKAKLDSIASLKARIERINKNLAEARDLAQTNADESEKEKNIAEKQKVVAEQQNNLFRALQLAERSLETPNVDTSMRLALTAFELFRDNRGELFDNKIYSAMQEALERSERLELASFATSPYTMAYDPENSLGILISMHGELLRVIQEEEDHFTVEPREGPNTHGNRFVNKSPDNKWYLMTDGSNRAVQIFDDRNCQLQFELKGHNAEVSGAIGFPDRKMVISGDESGHIFRWDLNQKPAKFVELADEIFPVKSFATDSKGKTIAAAAGNSIVFLSGNNFSEHISMTTDHKVSALLFDTQKPILYVGFENGHVGQFDLNTRKWLRMAAIHGARVSSIALSPDRRFFATASFDQTLRLYVLEQPDQPPLVLKGHEGWVTGLAFSKDSKFLYSVAVDKTMRKWFVEPKQLFEVLKDVDAQRKLTGKAKIKGRGNQ